MELVRLETLNPRGWVRPVVAVGNFDGVHRGHQALLAVVRQEAAAAGGTAVVLTFDPHPSRILSPDRAPSTLMTFRQKAEVLAGLGIEVLASLPFTRELAEEPPEPFARLVLRQALGAEVVVVGTNFRFGRGRQGDPAVLAELGARWGFLVKPVPPVLHQGAPISSTRIREALGRGEVRAARELLGRRFFVDGTVVAGEGRGRALGIPTINLQVINEALPALGVYACWCRPHGPGGGVLPAVTNLGRRPTFGASEITLEAHLLDFAGDLYGREVRLEFEERLREERRFENAQALREQIGRDIGEARRVLGAP